MSDSRLSDSSAQRKALIVGGASGIGRALATDFAAEGTSVTIADLNADFVAVLADEIGGSHAGVDVTDEDSVAAMFDQTGPLDIVVNTTGIGGLGRITEMPLARFRSVVDSSLIGGFLVMKHAGRHLRDGGSLVTLTSLNAQMASPGLGAFSAAKAGVVMLTRVAALEFAPRRIRVNAVSPGFANSPLGELVAQVPGATEEYVENTPLGRVGTPRDVADAVMFLCSDKAAWITGEVINLCGGAQLTRFPNVLAHFERMTSG